MEAQLQALSPSATDPAIPMTINRDQQSTGTTTPTTVLPGPTTLVLQALAETPSDRPWRSLPMLTCTPAEALFPSMSPLLLTRLQAERRCPWVFVVEAVSQSEYPALCTPLILLSQNSARPSRAMRCKLHRSAQNAAKDNYKQETATRLHTLPNLHPFIHSICLSKGLWPVGLCARDGLYIVYPCSLEQCTSSSSSSHSMLPGFVPAHLGRPYHCPLPLHNCTHPINASKWHQQTTA